MKTSSIYCRVRMSMFISMLLCVVAITSADSAPPDYTQFGLPEGAIARLGKGDIEDIAISPDGKRLAVASRIGVWLYDTQTGDALSLFTGHESAVRSVAFSPDGVTVASGSGLGDHKSIRLWDTNTGEHRMIYFGIRNDVGDLAFSPDGLLLVSGDRSGNVILWDMTTGERKHNLLGNSEQVLEVVFSPDGKTVAIASLDNDIHAWDVETGQPKHKYSGHTNRVYTIAFSHDGSNFASAGTDGTIRFWDPETGQLKKTIPVPETGLPNKTIPGQEKWIDSIAFSPDGKTLLSSSNYSESIRLWNVISGEQVKSLTPPNFGVAKVLYSANSDTVVCMNLSGNIHFLDFKTGTNKLSIKGHSSAVDVLAIALDSKTLASTNGAWVKLWDLETRRHKLTLKGHAEPGIASKHSLAFSADNRTVASADFDGIINLWDYTSGKHTYTLKVDTGAIRSLAFSPDGKKFACAGEDNTVRIWDAENSEEIRKLVDVGDVLSVAFSPDSQTLASGSNNGVVHLWDVNTGSQKLTFKTEGNGESIAFSPNGILIASSGKTVKLWHSKTGEEILTLGQDPMQNIGQQLRLAAGNPEQMRKFHESLRDTAQVVAFSPDGNKLAVLREMDVIRLWDIEKQVLIKTFEGHKRDVHAMDFSPDGKLIASGGEDGTILLWEVPQ
ncbi:WD40 repeat domain-containing protein [Candidatus Poribacteria bacterium]|nr:WD40 repeat domain-containing protein [Candidatus Poribacteria bacterium]